MSTQTAVKAKVFYLRSVENFLRVYQVFPDRVLIDEGFGFHRYSTEAAREHYRQCVALGYKSSDS
jgi:hypothetical protein